MTVHENEKQCAFSGIDSTKNGHKVIIKLVVNRKEEDLSPGPDGLQLREEDWKDRER